MTFGPDQRRLLYQTMAAQLSAGVTPQKAFEMLHKKVKISPEINKVAKFAASAGAEGRLVTEGLAESGYIPRRELGILRIAELNNGLESACRHLQQKTTERISLANAVLVPNLYFGTILVLLIFAGYQAKDLLDTFDAIAVQNSPAYKLSLALNTFLFPVLTLILSYCFLASYGSHHWVGFARRFLWFFDTEYKADLALRYLSLAEDLYSAGANHETVLNATEDAFGGEGYVRWAVARVRQRHRGEGMSIADALEDGLLPSRLAALFDSMTPGDEHSSFVPACRAISELQRATRTRFHIVMKSIVRMIILLSIVFLILTLTHGVYNAVLAKTAQF